MNTLSSMLFGTSVSDQLIQLADADEQERLQRFKEAWNAYTDGSDDPLKPAQDGVNDSIIVPYEQVIVDKGKSFLFGDNVAFNVVPDDDEQLELDQRRLEKKLQERRKFKEPDNEDFDSLGPTTDRGEGEKKEKSDEDGEDSEAPKLERDPPTRSQLAQKYLDRVWKRNRKMTLLLKLGTNGGVFGHSFVKFVVKPGQELPRLVVLDPATVSVEWDDEDIDDEPYAYKITWNTVDRRDPENPKGIARRQRIERVGFDTDLSEYVPESTDEGTDTDAEDKDPVEPVDTVDESTVNAAKWLIIDEWADMQGGSPSLAGWNEISTKYWPYEWPPIIDAQNIPIPNEYWGKSDIEEIKRNLVYSINRLLSNMNRIIRLHAHPQIIGVGLTPEQVEGLEFAPDSILPVPPNAEITALEMQSDLKSSIETYLKLKELLHEVTRIPEVAAGKLESAGNLSGTALDILYGPLKELTQEKRQTYGEMLETLNQRILEYGGYEGLEVVTNWPDIVPKDDVAEGNSFTLDKQFGASNETILEARGYDPEQERERRENEHAEAMQHQADFIGLQGPVAENDDGGKPNPDKEKVENQRAVKKQTGD